MQQDIDLSSILELRGAFALLPKNWRNHQHFHNARFYATLTNFAKILVIDWFFITPNEHAEFPVYL
ncbi:hypothetical protein V1477_005773 [Vespula maculifrons]|uniref:Uncharacterized protein n=1 Tax=Vespula maculifrons TaxID=7453 RepID=A0ABD2CM89_VESMC